MDNTSPKITLTQRIVGAIVVISLAIIFVPALLEKDLLDPGKFTESPIPEVPREISTIVFQLNELNGKFEGNGLTASAQLTKEVSEAIQKSTNEIVEVKPNDGSKKSISNPIKLDDGKQHSWMLQLASFKEKPNAYKLRDSLRKKQYVAHVDERQLSSGSIWRVRVGPVLTKNKIISLQNALEKDFKLKGLIVRRR